MIILVHLSIPMQNLYQIFLLLVKSVNFPSGKFITYNKLPVSYFKRHYLGTRSGHIKSHRDLHTGDLAVVSIEDLSGAGVETDCTASLTDHTPDHTGGVLRTTDQCAT